jgi:hypothetical protein
MRRLAIVAVLGGALAVPAASAAPPIPSGCYSLRGLEVCVTTPTTTTTETSTDSSGCTVTTPVMTTTTTVTAYRETRDGAQQIGQPVSWSSSTDGTATTDCGGGSTGTGGGTSSGGV